MRLDFVYTCDSIIYEVFVNDLLKNNMKIVDFYVGVNCIIIQVFRFIIFDFMHPDYL